MIILAIVSASTLAAALIASTLVDAPPAIERIILRTLSIAVPLVALTSYVLIFRTASAGIGS